MLILYNKRNKKKVRETCPSVALCKEGFLGKCQAKKTRKVGSGKWTMFEPFYSYKKLNSPTKREISPYLQLKHLPQDYA